MHIRKLELQGFKSFADRMTFHFGPGISGVVGPNGCGKSNVVDGVKWCIGEQSAKSLRGDSMADVIFAGSAARPAVNLAEVSITFVAGAEPFPGIWARFPELDVTRRLYRDGHSEYLINQERVRLRDVQDLLMDSGAGNQLYSFIEQGRIGQIVQARPEQRRTLIEEAAGISRYKLRRQETLEKLEGTRASLERVADLAEELGRQLRSTERAVQRAARWRQLGAKVRQEEIVVGLARCAGLIGDRKALGERLKGAREGLEEATRAVDRHEQDLAARRQALELVEEEANRLRDQLAEAEGERRVEESALQYVGRETQAAQARLQQLGVDQEELRRERDAAGAEAEARDEARKESERRAGLLRAEIERLVVAVREHTGALEDARRALGASRQEAMGAFEAAVRAKAVRSGMEARRADLGQRAERHRARVAETRTEGSHVDEEIERIRGLVGGAEAEVGEARAQVEAAQAGVRAEEQRREEARSGVRAREAEVRTKEQAVFQKEQVLTAASRAREQVHARVDALDALVRQGGGAPDGVKSALAVPGTLGMLAAHLDVPEALEGLLNRALEGGLDTVLVPDAGTARAVGAALKGGRAKVFVVAEGGGELPGWAAGVGGTELGLRALGALLRGVEVVESTAELATAWAPGRRVVARQGGARREDGVWLFGVEVNPAAAALKQRRDLAAARDELAAKDAVVDAAKAEVTAAREAVPTARAAVEEAVRGAARFDEAIRAASLVVETARTALRTKELALAEVRHKLNAQQAAKAQAERAAAALVAEEDGIRRAGQALDEEDRRAADAITAAEGRQAAAEVKVREAQRRIEQHDQPAREAQERLQRARVEVATVQGELAGHVEAVASARNRAARAASRSEQVARERSDLETRLVQLAIDQERASTRLQVLGEQVGTLRESLDAKREDVRQQKERVRVAETQARAARDRRDEARDQVASLETKLAEVRASLERVRGEVEERHGISLPGLLDRLDRDGQLLLEGWEGMAVGELELPEPVPVLRVVAADLERDVPARATALGELRTQLHKLGEVNLAAEEEYREVAVRHEDIERQRADLVEAMRIIEEAIARINKTCRERFRETFDLVNENFGRLYPRLVGGGSARLQLTDEDDLLTTGVEIVVQPPGKKVQNLTLLSGGEKAMAALGLVFSLFLVKPSPFCLLDEVDAPLDEGNGARFNDMLREMAQRAQFIVITHNKKTMECADVLYGITMPEPGASRLVTVKIE